MHEGVSLNCRGYYHQ